MVIFFFFFFTSRRRHTRFDCDWSSDVCSSDLLVILPVIHKEESKSAVLSYAHALAGKLRHLTYQGALISVFVDEKEIRGGEKTWGWIKKGVPMRIEVGPREVESRTLSVYRRD